MIIFIIYLTAGQWYIVKVTKFTCVSDHFEAVNKKLIIWYNL
jgi:hypothetical protein